MEKIKMTTIGGSEHGKNQDEHTVGRDGWR